MLAHIQPERSANFSHSLPIRNTQSGSDSSVPLSQALYSLIALPSAILTMQQSLSTTQYILFQMLNFYILSFSSFVSPSLSAMLSPEHALASLFPSHNTTYSCCPYLFLLYQGLPLALRHQLTDMPQTATHSNAFIPRQLSNMAQQSQTQNKD